MHPAWLRRRRPVRPPEVILLGRAGCHLCAEAHQIVDRVARDLGVDYCERDVDSDPELLARYTDLVPVLLIDGAEHARWRVAEDALRAALAPYTPRRQ